MTAPGATLGVYRIERALGSGGMGTVFLAYDTSLHRQVAVKVMDAADGETSRAHLLREARSAAALNHPHICTIHEVGDEGGTTFIAMEYVEGQSLRDRLDAGGALPREDVLRYGIHAADALAFAHEHGVIHRDLKAANAMITTGARLKVVDFGLARRHDALTTDATTLGSIAQAGAPVGTPYAMAPEQVRGEPADARTDVWALGVLIYEMATGRKPFDARTIPELFSAILKEPPRRWPRDAPAALQPIVDRCLEKDPSRRYQTAREVQIVLETTRSGPVPAWPAWRHRWAQSPAVVAVAAAIVLTLGFVGANVGGLRDRLSGDRAPAAIKLAVLPFANLTGDSGQEFFSDGLTDELIGQLGRLHPQLRVIARSTSAQYRSNASPIEALGRDLGVEYVLEGSARREGDRVRISATLIQVRDRTQRWSQTFDREMSGFLTVQHDVARGVSGALALTLLPAQQRRLAGAPLINPQAYEAYLIGQSHERRLTRPELDRALEYYETALTLDPNFALAHYGVRGVWAARLQVGLVTQSEEGGRAEAALRRALAIDPELPEGHMALGNRATWVEWDWPAAEASFRRALDLNPSLAEAHAFYAHYLYITHRPEQGAAEILRALDLDPLNDLIQQFYGMTLRFDRRFGEGIEHAQRVLKTNPNSPSAWTALAENCYQLGRFDEAVAAQKNAIGARGNPANKAILAALNEAYAGGDYAAAMRQFAEFREAMNQPWPAAQDFIRAGQFDRALDTLERLYETRNQSLAYISVAPIFDPIRSHPRFRALLKKMNLPA
jgi:TolB-like protein/tetratricopeptide (TPR) repeat protein/predicted Ser/Thr protein kinase